MFSKVKFLGHPVHPMLVAFPVAFYAATLVSFVANAATGNAFWFQVGVIANIAGVVCAAAAAVPGFVDWTTIPSRHPAKSTGIRHMALNVGSLVVFGINALVHAPHWDDFYPSVGLAVALSLVGFAMTLGAGFLGWKMVGKHHVGVDLTPEQERIDFINAARARASRPSFHGV